MKLNFCTECAAPLHKQTDTDYVCDNGHPYYNNPRAASCVIFINDRNELLFAKRAYPPQKDKYYFPGGFVNFGEDAFQAACREVKEETGANLFMEDLQLIDSEVNYYMDNIMSCDTLFVSRQWSGEMMPADDAATLEWKPLEFLKSNEFAWSYPHLYGKLQKVMNQ